MMTRTLLALMILLTTIGCQPARVESPLPTLALLPTETAAPPSPTRADTPTATMPPPPTETASPAVTAVTTATASTTPTTAATATAAAPAATGTPLPEAFIFGRSADGRSLEAYRYGTGGALLMLVGGIHAGYEANTIRLLEELQGYFERTPGGVLPGVTVLLIPALNPDGATYGRQIRGRFNGNNVDLNRNWDCNWSPEAVFRSTPVGAGEHPFSEPESQALGGLIQRVQPDAVLFYHAAARGVFSGRCGEPISEELAAVYGEAAGYPYGDAFGDYRVTGSAPGWVNSLGIPAADVELATADDTEFIRNLNAILAVQRWLVAQNTAAP